MICGRDLRFSFAHFVTPHLHRVISRQQDNNGYFNDTLELIP